MLLVKVLPHSVGYLTRYRSTCADCDGQKATTSWPYEVGRRLFIHGDSDELPCEPVALVFR